MKLPPVVTVAYGGRIRIGKGFAQGHDGFGVHLDGIGGPHDQGTFTNLFERDEHVKWLRGTYTPDSPEAQALLVAEALT